MRAFEREKCVGIVVVIHGDVIVDIVVVLVIALVVVLHVAALAVLLLAS